MRRWFSELNIVSNKVSQIKSFLLNEYDFEEISDLYTNEDPIIKIEDNKLLFEGDDGIVFVSKETKKVPNVEELFINICKNLEDITLSGVVREANSIDNTLIEYEINYDNDKLIIMKKENNQIEKNEYKKENNFEINDEKPSLINNDENKTIVDYFIEEVEVYNMPCTPSIFILNSQKEKYFLEVYYDMGYLLINLYNRDFEKKIITIEREFDENQMFTKQIAIEVFDSFNKELQKEQIRIISLRIANNEELSEYYSYIIQISDEIKEQ